MVSKSICQHGNFLLRPCFFNAMHEEVLAVGPEEDLAAVLAEDPAVDPAADLVAVHAVVPVEDSDVHLCPQ